MTIGLIAFLNARLDEDEAAAKHATPGPWRIADMAVYGQPSFAAPSSGETMVIRHTWPQEAAHIARHDPARVLREVAAKRAILAMWSDPDVALNPHAHGYASGVDDEQVGRAMAIDEAVRNMTAIWCGHPDYDPAWTPEDAR